MSFSDFVCEPLSVSFSGFKEEKDLEVKKAEINSYFETEVKKNGFTEVELNSLKADFVDKMDFDGLQQLGLNAVEISAKTLPLDFERSKQIHNCWLITLQ